MAHHKPVFEVPYGDFSLDVIKTILQNISWKQEFNQNQNVDLCPGECWG